VSSHIVVILVSVTEGTALLLFSLIIIPSIIKIVEKVKVGTRVNAAVQHEFQKLLPAPLLVLVKFEVGLWAAFVRGIFRKKDVPVNSSIIDYGYDFRVMTIVVACLTPIEIGLLELLCQHFNAPFGLHLTIWIVSTYAALWVIGLALSIRVYPHYVTQSELVFRYCWYHTIRVEIDHVEKVVLEKRECIKNKTIEYGTDLIALNDMRVTNMSIYFKKPYRPIIDDKLANEDITRFSFSADNPQAAANGIHSMLECMHKERDAKLNDSGNTYSLDQKTRSVMSE
jgi:hypothetical protein